MQPSPSIILIDRCVESLSAATEVSAILDDNYVVITTVRDHLETNPVHLRTLNYRLGRVLIGALLGLTLFSSAQEESAKPQPTPTTLITDLPSYWFKSEYDNVRPIKMLAVVHYYDSAWNHMWVEVNGEGGYIKCATKLPISSNDRILIEGTVIPAKGISADTAKITILERDLKPPPMVVDGKLHLYDQLKAKVVSFEATLGSVVISDAKHLTLEFEAEGHLIHAFYWTPNPILVGFKRGSRMRVAGVYCANQNPLTEKREIDLWCSRLDDFILLETPEPDPKLGRTAETPITDLTGFWLEEARDKVRPIKLEMVVNYYDGGWDHMWVNVNRENGYLQCATKLPIRSRDRILVEGTVIPSKGISSDTAKITILERDVRQTPLLADGQLSLYAQLKAKVVSFEATFDSVLISDGHHLMFEFIAEGYRVHAFYWEPDPKIPDFKQGSRMRITGVYSANQDPLTEKMEIDLWCCSLDDLVLLGPPETDPRFETTVVPIEKLPTMYIARAAQAHIAGIVRTNNPGHSVLVRDETGGIRVQTLQSLPLKAGEWIEAIGTPITGGADWSLRNAIIRRATPSVIAEKTKAAEAAPATLRVIDQVLALNPKEAAAGHQVDVVGVTLWSHQDADFIYISDTSGSVRVQLPEKLGGLINKPRSQLRIVGKTRMGTFAPEIQLLKSSQFSSALFPEAKELTLDQAMTGLEEGKRVTMQGYVQRVAPDGIWSRMTLSTKTGTFDALLAHEDRLNSMVGSIVSVQGVCCAVTNARRQLTRVEILALYYEDFRVEQSALADPFTAPLREISALRQFKLDGPLDYWVRVRGVVTQHVPGRFVIIQDGTEGLMLLTEQKENLVAGDYIEVTGLPGFENGRAVMRESVYRRLGHQNQPTAVEVTDAKAFAEELDSCLIKVRGTLLNSALDGENLHLEIKSGQRVFTALLHQLSTQATSRPLHPGSELELVGVYQLIRDERQRPQGFRIQLRTRADINVLQNPSWWTPARAFAVTGILVGCIALALTWLSVLRRRVKKQTDQLRIQILKEAKLEAHNRAIVANANDCIFTTDLSGNFTSFNPASEHLLGYSQEEILKLNLRDLVAKDKVHTAPELIASLMGKGQLAARFELRLVAKDQHRVWTEINACIVHTEGGLDGVLGVARDIGERKQIEEELKRARDAAEANTEAKSAFLANMSHEIRTPMNGVIGMSNLILDTKLNPEQREYAETIRNSAESLLTVLNDILDFSKIEAGKLHFETLNFDLVSSAEECLELLNPRASEKRIELSLFAPPEMPRLVKGDQGRLRQVLVNLLGNAIKFTDNGEVAVSLSIEEETAADLMVRFEVRDTGVGIASENIERLFQPFSQADGSTTRRYGGTGLGLVISKQLVQLMQGTIGVTSTPGQGSTFWFIVKLEKQTIDPTASTKMDQKSLAGLRMLVVDDHAQNRRIAIEHASHWGMRCHAVSTAGDALLALNEALERDDPYRIMLFDCQLPEVEFPTLAEAIRVDQRLKHVKLIALTLQSHHLNDDDCTRLKIGSVITKPLHPEDLFLALENVLSPTNSTGTVFEVATKPPSTSPVVPAQQTRILVAEDNVVNQRVILLQLKKLGYQAELANNGLEVLQALERSSYGIVFMDCQMPEMDGYEATRMIRSDKRYAKLRIIAMTANAMQGDREKCLAAGMDDYLSKPTRLVDLKNMLAVSTKTGS